MRRISRPESPEQVFAAVLDPRSWWGKGIRGGTSQVGDEFVRGPRHPPQPDAPRRGRAGRAVVWHAVDNVITFTEDQKEWDGTGLHFDISGLDDGRTELRFTHVGLVPAFECYDVCQNAWTFYVTTSLRRLVTTGTGLPNEHGDEVAAVVARMEAAAR